MCRQRFERNVKIFFCRNANVVYFQTPYLHLTTYALNNFCIDFIKLQLYKNCSRRCKTFREGFENDNPKQLLFQIVALPERPLKVWNEPAHPGFSNIFGKTNFHVDVDSGARIRGHRDVDAGVVSVCRRLSTKEGRHCRSWPVTLPPHEPMRPP